MRTNHTLLAPIITRISFVASRIDAELRHSNADCPVLAILHAEPTFRFPIAPETFNSIVLRHIQNDVGTLRDLLKEFNAVIDNISAQVS